MDGLIKELFFRASQIAKPSSPLSEINLFSILNMENKEVSAHSAFLHYIFSPFADETSPNGIDDNNLRKLLSKLLNGEFNTNQMECLDIFREVSTSYGRMDFVIKFTIDGIQHTVVIELKIWAGEQSNQIGRYAKYLRNDCGEKDTENRIFFLTPSERNATTGNAKNITLKNEIYEVLDEIIHDRSAYKDYCSIIRQYQRIINYLTGADTMCEDTIINNSQDLFCAKTISKAYQKKIKSIKRNVFVLIYEKLTIHTQIDKFRGTIISDVGMLDEDSKFEGKISGPVIYAILNKEFLKLNKELFTDVDVAISIEYDPNMFIAVRLFDENKKTKEINSDIQNNIKDAIESYQLDNSYRCSYPSWSFFWRFVMEGSKQIDLSSEEKEKNGFLRLLSKNDKLCEIDENRIDSIVDFIVETIEKATEIFFVNNTGI